MNAELLKLIGDLTEDLVFKVKNANLYGIAHGSVNDIKTKEKRGY